MYLDIVLIHICRKLGAACQLQVKEGLSYGKLMKVIELGDESFHWMVGKVIGEMICFCENTSGPNRGKIYSYSNTLKKYKAEIV